jgi:hypothetical protein
MSRVIHNHLEALAREAIRAVFSDRSVSPETVQLTLEELRDEIDSDIEAIQADIKAADAAGGKDE